MVQTARHYFSRGADSLVVDLSMHVVHRSTLLEKVRGAGLSGDALVFMGGEEVNMYDSDTMWDFRQESNLQYLFGVKEPGCFGVILLSTGESLLFITRFPIEYAQWHGEIKTPNWFKETYLVDSVYYVDEMAHVLVSHYATKSVRYYDYVNRDSGEKLPIPSKFPESERFEFLPGPELAYIINELRLIKTAPEIEIMQYTNDVSSKAHIDTMCSIYSKKHGVEITNMEHFAESNFRFSTALQGCARAGYHCIACSGINNAVLHYGHAAEPNNNKVENESCLRLLDMGAEYHCYTADVTCTFPTSGVFLKEQKAVYESVWAAVLAVEQSIKPGVDYRDMQRYSHDIMLKQLVDRTNLFKTKDLSLLKKYNVITYLCPHGLGHALGLMVHDVAIPPGEEKDKTDISLKGLRLPRVLMENMVLTVEPGIYFIEYLIEEMRQIDELSNLINFDEMYRYRTLVGGVRIEDNVVITDSGCRVLTDVPRQVEDIEKVMVGEIEWIVGQQYRVYSH